MRYTAEALVDVFNRSSEEYELKINREKAECMVVSNRSEAPVCTIQMVSASVLRKCVDSKCQMYN